MQNIKEKRLKELGEHRDSYINRIAAFNDLLEKLGSYEGKVINKNFFEKFYSVKNEWRDYTMHEIVGKEWDWSKFPNRLLVRVSSSSYYIELNSRERVEVIRALTEERDKTAEWLKGTEKEIAATEAIDVDQLIKDLIALRDAAGVTSSIWHAVVDLYEVKYLKD